MTASVIPGTGELMVAAVVGLVAAVTVALVVTVWLRRRLARIRLLITRHSGRLALEVLGVGRSWLLSRPLPDRRWWKLQRERLVLSRAVAAAEHAVKSARSGGAPLGDLALLCRRLRRSASELDRALRIAQHAGGPAGEAGAFSRQGSDLLEAAHRIQAAAAGTLASTSSSASSELVDEVRLEAAALSAGVDPAAASFAGADPLGSSAVASPVR